MNGCCQTGQVFFSEQALKHMLDLLNSIVTETKTSHLPSSGNQTGILQILTLCKALDGVHISA